MKQDMTGLWFTEGDEFKAWMSKRNSTLWLSGVPGAGKTILFSSIVDKLQRAIGENAVMAYFCCDYRNPVKQDATMIIRSLIRQFAEHNDLCFDKLEEFYEFHSSDDKVTLPTQRDLVTMLIDMSEDVDDALILIDALDECLTERAAVIKLLRDLNIQSQKIKTLFSSRDEVDISAQLQGYTTVSMAENTSDISRYVKSELKVKEWAKDLGQKEKESIKDSLIEPAGGMFRLVACQLDALAKCKTAASRRKVLKTLPRDLSETYSRILKHIDSTEIADNRVIVQRVLRWVTWAAEGLSSQQLQEAIAINAGNEELDPDVITPESDILDLCSSRVRCNPTGIIELAHATVKEFLTTIPPTSEYYFYHVDEKSDMEEPAVTCLTYLCLDNFGEDRDWDSESISSGSTRISFNSKITGSDQPEKPDVVLWYHFLDHAAKNWDYYAGKVTENCSPVLALEKVLFTSAKSPQFLNWAKHRLEPTKYRRNYDGGLLAESTTLQLVALLGRTATSQWLIDQGSDVNQATVVLGSPLTCAVLGESVFHLRTDHGSDSGSDNGSSNYDDDYNVRKSRAWHSENRYRTIATLLSCGAIMDGMPSEESRSLMELALLIGEPSHIKLLLSHGATLDTDCLAYLETQCSESSRQKEMLDILSTVTKSNYASTDAQKATKLIFQFGTSSGQAAKLLADSLEDLTKGEGTEVQDKNVALRKVSEYGRRY
ncbi:hypothetical protein ONS96_014838 [Cadophora gregata f. sp. sojae]|nr:hypothetical protein ONS96_014838 [Cadophora gregata f. sp. sojae]